MSSRKVIRKKDVFGKSMMMAWKYSVEGTEACSVFWLLTSNAMSELINLTLGQVVGIGGSFAERHEPGVPVLRTVNNQSF
jgi:hypothetical protein